MLGGIFRKSNLPLGLDIGAHSLRLVQLEVAGSRVSVTAAAREPLPADLPVTHRAYHAAVAGALRDAVRRGGFSQRQVVSVLPSEAVHCKNLRLPRMPAEELAAAVQFEACDRARVGDTPQSVQYLSAGEVRQGDGVRQEVILLAADLGFVESHVKTLVEAGLRPRAIDAVATAMARRGGDPSASAGAAGGSRVVIDLGWSATKLMISRAGQVLFYKPIDLGLARLAAAGGLAVADAPPQEPDAAQRGAMETPLADLAREIGLCLRYYGVTFRGARPESACIIGGGSLWPWLVAALAERSGLALHVGQATGGLDWSAVRQEVPRGEESAWMLAVNLALRTQQAARPQDETADQDAATRGVAA